MTVSAQVKPAQFQEVSLPAVEKGIVTLSSVLYFEVRDAAGLADSVAPDLFSGFMSSLFEGITALVYANHGSITKYCGNGVLATFGYPVFYNNDIYNAVKCALEIRNFIGAYNQRRPIHIKTPVLHGVGISTGKIFAGTVGSIDRKEHMVAGETVNTAVRLQSLTRQAEVDILVDEETFHSLPETLEGKRVKFLSGRDKSIETTIYCVINMKANAPVATALSDAELESTYSNKIGEVEFF